MRLTVYKMQACGNDFLILDYMNFAPPVFYPKEIQWLCDRHFGPGADGLVLLKPGERSHASWKFYNSDGSEAEMCGNAARCAILYLTEKYFPTESPISLETKAGVVRGRVIDKNRVELALFKMGEEKGLSRHRVIPTGEHNIELYSINTGVPHVVIEVKDIYTYPIIQIGRSLVRHEAFGSQGTNVTFYQRLVGPHIRATTFERGVEKETFACGTGVAAASLVYSEQYMQQYPIEVNAPGGDFLVDVSPVSNQLLLIGPAEHVYTIEIDDIRSTFEQPTLYSERKGKPSA